MEEALKAALRWWEEEAQYLTTGDYGGHNVFDDTPEWVPMARKAVIMGNKPYKEQAALLQEADALGIFKPVVRMRSKAAELWQSDIDVLDVSINEQVRISETEDAEVKSLYNIWKSL